MISPPTVSSDHCQTCPTCPNFFHSAVDFVDNSSNFHLTNKMSQNPNCLVASVISGHLRQCRKCDFSLYSPPVNVVDYRRIFSYQTLLQIMLKISECDVMLFIFLATFPTTEQTGSCFRNCFGMELIIMLISPYQICESDRNQTAYSLSHFRLKKYQHVIYAVTSTPSS